MTRAATIREDLIWEGRALTATWLPAPFEPPKRRVTQVSGVCFAPSGKIVLVAGQLGRWALPGGHLEPGETFEQTLRREVLEEACAIVRRMAYLGAQKVDDPNNPTGRQAYFQLRYWTRVELKRFKPRFERTQRTLVPPSAWVDRLGWRTTRIAQALLDAALEAEARYTRAPT